MRLGLGTGTRPLRDRRYRVARVAPLAVLSVVVTAVVTAPAAGVSRTHVIQGDSSIGGIRLGRTPAPRAAAFFAGEGVRRVRRRPNSCIATWPRIGLTVNFGTLGSDPTNPCTGGVAFTVTITDRAAWRTAVGLRVGDSTVRLRRLYPQAVLHTGGFGGSNGYWLVTRHACREVGGGVYPGLLARLIRRRVSAIVATAGICD